MESWREGERGSRQCFHTHPCRFFSFLSRPPWALTVTLLYHPWIINPFLKSPLWVQELWALLFSYWWVARTQILGNFSALYVSNVSRKLHLTSTQETYQNMPARAGGAWKQPCFSEVPISTRKNFSPFCTRRQHCHPAACTFEQFASLIAFQNILYSHM